MCILVMPRQAAPAFGAPHAASSSPAAVLWTTDKEIAAAPLCSPLRNGRTSKNDVGVTRAVGVHDLYIAQHRALSEINFAVIGSNSRAHAVLRLKLRAPVRRIGRRIVRIGFTALATAFVAAIVPVAAQAVTQSYQLDIPREQLDAALRDLAQQTGLQIARFSDSLGGSLFAGPIKGDIRVADALKSLLTPNQLTYEIVNDHTIAVMGLGITSERAEAADSSQAFQTVSIGTGDAKQQDGSGSSFWGRLQLAQVDHGETANSTNGTTLTEIVVTAQRRPSTVQTTPISITAIAGDDARDRGITDIISIVQSVPGVSMKTSGPGQTELEMRGLVSSGGNSPTVGFYLDDIPLTAPASAQNGKVVISANLYDLNRIEVLRGPQGTIYGSGSMGGTIKLVPNVPNTSAFDTSAEVIFGGTDGGDSLNRTENGMVNLPLSDTLAVRVVGTVGHSSGWINRIVIEQPDFPSALNASIRGNVAAAPVANDYHDVNDENFRSVRAALLWNPTDRLSIEPSFMYEETTQGGLSLIDNPPGAETNYQPYDAPEPFEDRIDIGGLNVQYHFDPFDLSSTTSFWTRDEILREDGTEEFAFDLGSPVYPSEGGVGPSLSFEDDRSKQYSEEIRLTSAGLTNFKWLAGYFYQDFESNWDYSFNTPFIAIPGTFANALTVYQPTKIVQNAVFGEVSYTFLDQLTATFGLRHYHYHGSESDAQSGWISASGSNAYAYSATGESDSGVTPKLNLSYQLGKQVLVYGTAAQGFRPGGGNFPVPSSGTLGSECTADLQALGFSSAPPSFKPDKVWSYELGEKFRSTDGRVTVNSAGYFENWQHIQQYIPLQCGDLFTANSGDAHIYGAELEVNVVLFPELVASMNGSWLHAEYISNAVPTTTIGERVQDVPEVTGSASLAYHHGISHSLALIGRVDSAYVGSRIDTTAQANYLPGYALTNIRGGVEGDHWSAVLFVKNLTNKMALLTNSPSLTLNSPTFNRTAVEQPRTFGFDINYHFGVAGRPSRR